MKNIKKLSWREFANLEEVQIDESPTGYGNALFYNDGKIQISVDFESKEIDKNGEVIANSKGHDDMTIWEDENLIKELQSLVIDRIEENI